jgi:hypothetical protein
MVNPCVYRAALPGGIWAGQIAVRTGTASPIAESFFLADLIIRQPCGTVRNILADNEDNENNNG